MPGIESWLQYGAFGVMTMILVGLGLFFWRVWKWFTVTIAEPFIERHNQMIVSQIAMSEKTMKFMDAMKEHADKEESVASKIADTQVALEKAFVSLSRLAMQKI